MTTGFASGLGVFMLGWLSLAASTLWTNTLPRWASLSVLVGLLTIPLLGATRLSVYGQVVGSVLFGVGLVGLGYGIVAAV